MILIKAELKKLSSTIIKFATKVYQEILSNVIDTPTLNLQESTQVSGWYYNFAYPSENSSLRPVSGWVEVHGDN